MNVGEDWRTRLQSEVTAGLDSDVVKLSHISIGSLFVLQISYDPKNPSGFQQLVQNISGTWVNAVSENFSGGITDVGAVPWSSAYESLGDYGFDPSSHVAWAVLDHSGTYAVTVPEAASIGMLIVGAAGLTVRRTRRRLGLN